MNRAVYLSRKSWLRLTSVSLCDGDCTEFPVCPRLKKKVLLTFQTLIAGCISLLIATAEQYNIVYHTQWYPKVMCSETWTFPVFGSSWPSLAPGLGKKWGHAGFCRFHSTRVLGSLSWSSWCWLVWLEILTAYFNSILPPSECTGDLWCILVLLVSCGCNTQLFSVENRAVPALFPKCMHV